MRHKILVTPRSLTATPHPAVEQLRASGFDVIYSTPGEIPKEDELISLIPDCVGWLAGVEPITPRVIDAARNLRVISRNGVGVDNLPMEALSAHGVAVEIAQGTNTLGVAELTIGLIFAALRMIPATDAGIKQGKWPRQRGGEIQGRTIGVIGCGAIGREVARMAIGIGAKVLGFDAFPRELNLPETAFRFAPLPEVLSASDIISLHCPPPKSGRPLIDEAALTMMDRKPVLINTARSSLVDTQAVQAALDRGDLFSYATDVFPEEPPKHLQLAGHARVIATSHIGGFTGESVDRTTTIAIFNLMRHLVPHGDHAP